MDYFSRLLRIETQRLQRILVIGVPIIGSMLSQSLINLVDAAMVGRLGDVALAAVGVGSYASFAMVSVVMGLSSAVQALIARRSGAGEHDRVQEPLMAGLLLSAIIAIPVSLLALLFAPQLMGMLSNDPRVVELATPYFQWRSAALIAVAMNFVYRGYWSGIGETRIYLNTLLLMHIANVVISYILIFGLGDWAGLGAVGSGIGTALALVFGTCIHTLMTFFRHRQRLGIIHAPNRSTLGQLAKLALPNSTQQTLFALGISAFFWIVGQIGTQEQAIGHILISLQLMLILPAVGMGIAATTLVGQALGAGDKSEAHQWGWEVTRTATLLIALLGVPLWLAPEWVLTIFTNEQPLIELGAPALRLAGLFIVFEVTAMVFTQALLGAGASKQVMTINVAMQWGVLLPAAYLVGPIAGYGLIGIWLIQGLQRMTLSVIYSRIWLGKGWSHISI